MVRRVTKPASSDSSMNEYLDNDEYVNIGPETLPPAVAEIPADRVDTTESTLSTDGHYEKLAKHEFALRKERGEEIPESLREAVKDL